MANVLNTTLTALRRGLLEFIDEWVGGTTTANGAADGSTIVDTTILPEYGNNRLNTRLVMATSGTYSGQVRRVKTSVQATGVLTMLTNFGGQILSSVTYELSPFHQDNYLRVAINDAILEVFPDLGRQVMNEDLISGNWLPNGSMRDWEGGLPTRWAKVGAGSTVALSTLAIRDWPSAALTRAGADCYIHCSETQWPGLIDLGGQSVEIKALVLATVASSARLSIYVNDASVATSSYHTGGGALELLTIGPITLTDSPNKISFRCEVNSNNTTANFTRIRVIGPQINRYLVPLAFSQNPPIQISLQTAGTPHGDEDACDDWGEIAAYQTLEAETSYDDTLGVRLLRFTTPPPAGYRLRLTGMEYMSTLAVEADTVPLDPPQNRVLYAKAAQCLFERLAFKMPEYKVKAEWARVKYEALRAAHGFQVPVPTINFGRWRY